MHGWRIEGKEEEEKEEEEEEEKKEEEEEEEGGGGGERKGKRKGKRKVEIHFVGECRDNLSLPLLSSCHSPRMSSRSLETGSC